MYDEHEDNSELVAGWRASADQDNPAGPLYNGGEFAEADMVNEIESTRCSLCTASAVLACC
jgi:hypothetical protein